MAAPPTFRAARKFLGPPWLVHDGAESELVGYTLDLLKDAFTERLRLGLLARLPQNDPTGKMTAPDDALAAMGRDRRIRRGFNESSQSYAVRLVRWLDDWKVAGNPFALMAQLAGYLGPLVSLRTVDVRGNWFSRAVDGTLSVNLNQANWDWDGAADALARWARFWVIIYPRGFWSTRTWDDGSTWGDGHTWGTTATPDQVASVRALIQDWKPAGTTCQNIIIAFDDASFDPTQSRDGSGLPDGLWGNWATVSGGAYVPSRLTTARYWDGV